MNYMTDKTTQAKPGSANAAIDAPHNNHEIWGSPSFPGIVHTAGIEELMKLCGPNLMIRLASLIETAPVISAWLADHRLSMMQCWEFTAKPEDTGSLVLRVYEDPQPRYKTTLSHLPFPYESAMIYAAWVMPANRKACWVLHLPCENQDVLFGETHKAVISGLEPTETR